MFWTMLCGRRVADGRWSTYWWTAPSAGWRLNDPKCAPCWPTAAVPGCSSACERKPPTCPAVFCSSVADGNKDPEHPESHERGLRKNNRGGGEFASGSSHFEQYKHFPYTRNKPAKLSPELGVATGSIGKI